VLVAVVIMAIMSLMAWQGVDGIVRARESNQVRLEQTLRLETVIAQWEQDLASLQETTPCRPSPATARACASPAGPRAGCRWSPGRCARQRDRDVAALGRAAGDDHDRAAGDVAAQPAVPGRRAGQLKALTGLDQWQVYFFQGNAWANCQSTGDVAARPRGVQRQALPSGVRLVLAFAPGSGLNGSLVRDTLLAP
jgi:general secretion pathway protein J